MARNTVRMSLLACSIVLAFSAQAQSSLSGQRDIIARLSAQSANTTQVTLHSVTGAASFVRAAPGGRLATAGAARGVGDAARQATAVQFLNEYGNLFGIKNASTELVTSRTFKDRQGGTHLTHKQLYQGLPVFGAELKSHFDAENNLFAVNGTFIPDISVNIQPTRSASEAAALALSLVKNDLGKGGLFGPALSTSQPTLMIFREGLTKGTDGVNRLVWQVEVGNRANVREFVFVDAHANKVIEQYSGIHTHKNRRAFDGASAAAAPGPNYPANPFWVEGQAYPTGTVEADNMIIASSEVYDLFSKAFGRDSYDGNGATMDSIFNRGWQCVNASWNGSFISFCPGTTTDDVTAHEWGHAYTEYTHGLIYAWQPGALNEAYSDIWGETVDRINGRGGDTPDTARTPGVCAVVTGPAQSITVTAPASIAGLKNAGTAAWGPQTFSVSGVIAGVEVGSTSAGCAALPAGSLTGKIAFIDRGTCGFSVKALNAQNAGAVAAIIGNNQGGTTATAMSLTAGSTPTIPSLMMSQNDGTALKAALGTGTVSVTMNRAGAPSYNTVSWLVGEDSSAFGGAIRDMYNPTCYNNPGKVSDTVYSCGPNTQAGDNGGVHSNSGVPNHAYALLVDGGTFNGQTISGIGLTKAAHIYYRAQTVYQGPASGFADHADAIQNSCTDLTGVNLASLLTGAASGEIINANDCAQVAKAALAVELRTPPAQCNFQPLLAQNPPALCPTGTVETLASDNFEGGKKNSLRWILGSAGVSPEFTVKNWGVVNQLPGNRAGYAMFVPDPGIGSCAVGGDQSGLHRLESPEVTVPAGTTAARMSFDHWVGTEGGYDGGNLKISVNGGAWQLVSAANFVFNPYNATMATAAAGNTSPLAGQPGFTGGDGGAVTGSWGRSIVNLSAYAVSGDKVKLRFEMGRDGCGGAFGWYVDDVNIYRCVAP